jgi:cyanophycinase-like exopeptidase
MTKFFLHGGYVNRPSDTNRAFFRDIIASVGREDVSVLCIYFARPERRWDESFAEDRSSLMAAASELRVRVDIALATYDIDPLLQQIADADLVFIAGGTKGHLRETLKDIPDLASRLDGKTVAGISAGANLLAAFYYGSVAGSVREGLRLLPIALLTHANRDAGHEAELLEASGNLPLYKVDEEKYIELQS